MYWRKFYITTTGIEDTSCCGKDIVVYDDYNHQIRHDQNTIGTITTTVGQGAIGNSFKIIEKTPILVGGFGEKSYGKQYRLGNRVYSSDSIAMCVMSQPVGNLGGYSYLYIVDCGEDKNEMWKFK